jgi:hypothetical protein
MSEVDTLTRNTQQEIERVGAADILVGIPSHNHAETIAAVVEAARTGLTAYFPALKAVIVNSDAGSTDGTPDRVLEAAGQEIPLLRLRHPVDPANKLVSLYHGISGRGSAFQTIFSTARKLGARVCVILDASLRSTSPEWVEALAGPVLSGGYDLAAPDYARHKYDAAINSGIVAPVTRALYGARVRHPIGGDFGVSIRLAEDCLEQDVWGTDLARFAVDLWLVTQAICGSFRTCQARLGARLHGPGHSAVQLSEALTQVVGALFNIAERNAGVWQRVRNSQPVPVLGDWTAGAPDAAAVNARRLIDAFRLGAQNLQEIWALVLPPAALLELRKLARHPDESFRFRDALWARIIYDFALGHRLRVIPRDHLLGALAPLYLGWLASFALETEQAGPQEAEDRLESLGQVFEAQKPYLISRWRWPDRFSP